MPLAARPRAARIARQAKLVAHNRSPRYNLRMRPRLAALPLLLSMMLGLACTIAKERPASNFAEATGGEAMERMFWKEVQGGNWTEIERIVASNYTSVVPG